MTDSPTSPPIPPADRGTGAWIFLCGCFWVEGLVWGLPFSYGVFQRYYLAHEPFSSHPSGLPAVGTTTTALLYFASPVAMLALQKWPSFRRLSSVVGLALMLIGLVAASFATEVVHLIVTQGILYGIGGAFAYSPFIYYLDEWFVERKGLAYGILWAGTGVGGLVIPFVINWGLETWGFRTTLRAWAIILLIIVSPLIFVIKPRLPVPPVSERRPLKLSFLTTRLFWLLQSGNILQGLGYFMPSIYLPTFATDIGFKTAESTLLVALLNFASILGTISIGWLTDRLHISSVIVFSAAGSAVSVFLLWGFTGPQPVLYVFAIAYGVYAGGYTATWTGCAKELQSESLDAETSVIIGVLAAGRGLGNVISGPISQAILETSMWEGRLLFAYGSQYGLLISFTGITAVLGALGCICRFRKGVRRRARWLF